MAPENVALVVELPQSSEEYGDSRDIDPAAATSAADRIFEFISASEDILGAGTFDGPSHGADWAVVQSGVPSNFVRVEWGEDDAWRARVIPSDFTHAEREEGDAWRDHMAIGAQIEENLSRALNRFSQSNLNVNSVSVLFVHFRYYGYNFHSCFVVYSSYCPCRGTRVTG